MTAYDRLRYFGFTAAQARVLADNGYDVRYLPLPLLVGA